MSEQRPCPTCGCVLYQESGPCLGDELLAAIKPLVARLRAEGILYEQQILRRLDEAEGAIAKAEGREEIQRKRDANTVASVLAEPLPKGKTPYFT